MACPCGRTWIRETVAARESVCDSMEIVGPPPAWRDVFAVFAVKTVAGDGVNVAVLDADRVERLRTVFWDMTKITTETKRVSYAFTEEQNAILDNKSASRKVSFPLALLPCVLAFRFLK